MVEFEGVYPALLTPQTQSEELNEQLHCRQIDYVLDQGVQGLWLCGGTGDGVLLTEADVARVTEITVQHVRRRAKVIVHIGAVSTRQTVAQARAAEELGADAVAAVPPFFYGRDSKSIVNYYETLSQETGLPLFIYNLPAHTGVDITPTLLEQLLHLPRLAGIKHSSLLLFDIALFRRIAGEDFAIFSGHGQSFLAALTLGANGSVGAMQCVMAPTFLQLFQDFKAGNLSGAMAQQNKILATFAQLAANYALPCCAKEILGSRLGADFGPARGPKRDFTPEERTSFLAEAQQLGLL